MNLLRLTCLGLGLLLAEGQVFAQTDRLDSLLQQGFMKIDSGEWGAAEILGQELYRTGMEQNEVAIILGGHLISGMASLGQAKIEQARENLLTVLHHPKAGSYPATLAKAKMNLGLLHHRTGKYEVARQIFEEVISAPFGETYEAKVRVLLGRVFFRQGYFVKAIEQYQQAIRADTFQLKDESISAAYGLLSIYLDRSEYDSAQQVLEEIRTLIPNSSRAKGNFFLAYGRYYEAIGEYAKARDYYYQVKTLSDSSHMFNGSIIASNNIGVTFRLEGSYEQALSIHMKNIQRARTYQHRRAEAYSHLNLGTNYYHLQQFDSATYHYDQSIQLFKEHGDIKEIGYIQFYRARVFQEQGLIERALSTFQDAIARAQKVQDYQTVIDGHWNRGIMLADMQQPLAALTEFQLALRLTQPEISAIEMGDLPEIEHIFPSVFIVRLLASKASAHHQLYQKRGERQDLEIAYQTYRLTTIVMESLWHQERIQKDQFLLSAESHNIFEHMIQVCLELYHMSEDDAYQEQAFLYAAKSKSAILLEAIQASTSRRFGGMPQPILDLERNLRKQLSFYQKKVQELPSPVDTLEEQLVAYYRSRSFVLQSSYDSLKKEIQANHPSYYELTYETFPQTIRTIQAQLDTSCLMIEYFIGQEHLYIFSLQQDKLTVYVEESEDLHERVDSLLGLIRDPFVAERFTYDSAHISQYIRLCSGLSQSLLEPVLQGVSTDNFRQLRIVPDGKLNHLPFEVLPYREISHQSADYHDYPWLIEQYAISYAYSSWPGADRDLPYQIAGTNGYIGFAPDYVSTMQSPMRGSHPRMGRLLHNREEVRHIQSLLGGKILEGEAASEVAFRQHAQQYQLVHVAAHAFIDDQHPFSSGILFASSANPDIDSLLPPYLQEEQDNFLQLSEIFSLSLPSRLLVLSACNTAGGKLYQGEGIMSLERAFRYAGSTNIVANLWQANDQVSADLMTTFFQYLTAGMATDEALRQAKLTHLERSARVHPFYWSGFVLRGKPEKISLRRKSENSYVFLIVMGGIFGLVVIWMFGTRKQHRQRGI
ncbi:MAG: CHAT domain-containing protein [Bacteroidota bacterium]